MKTKCCSKCKKEKSLKEFNNAKRYKDGLCAHCKVCEKKYQQISKEMRIKNNSTLEINETLPETKLCSRCKKTKPLLEFHKSKSGIKGRYCQCRDCCSEIRKEKEEINSRKPSLDENEFSKICCRCKETKKLLEFSKNKTTKDGHDNMCKMCCKKRSQEVRNKNLLGLVAKKSKICKKCNQEKSINEFYKNTYRSDGFTNMCKICFKENDDKRRKSKDYKNKRNLKRKNRMNEDPAFRLKITIGKAIYNTLKSNNGAKYGLSVWEKLEFNPEELKIHLENQFEDWMTWDNYGGYEEGKRKWCIDHKIPQILFPFDNMDNENFKKCWSLKNLRPLEFVENVKKGDKLIFEFNEVFNT